MAPVDPISHIGKFEILNVIGTGGGGIVYQARQTDLNRIVALKVLQGDDERMVDRFAREAKIAGQLSHPSIVPIYEVGEEAGRHFISMQFIDGAPLSGLRLTPRRAMEVLRDAALAVDYAHRQGFVHRDLKPQNIMVDRQGKVWVLDFGLARPAGRGQTMTTQGGLVGTPAYMPPEQAEGKNVDARADVYSLGATLFEALTSQPPFVGNTLYDVLERVKKEDPPLLRKFRPGLPPALEAILARAMERSPERRYRSANAFAEDLRRCLLGEPITTQRPSTAYRVRRWVRRRKRIVAAVACLALLSLPLVALRFAMDRGARLRDSSSRAQEAFRQGRWGEAILHSQHARRYGSDPTLDSLERISGKRLAAEARYRELRERIQQALPAFYQRAVPVQEKLHGVYSALQALEQLLTDPELTDDFGSWKTLGIGWLFVGDLERAHPSLMRAMDFRPEDPELNYYLARLYLERSHLSTLRTSPHLSGEQKEEYRSTLDLAEFHIDRAERGWPERTPLQRKLIDVWRRWSRKDGPPLLEELRACVREFDGEPGVEDFWELMGGLATGEEARQAFDSAIAIRPHHALVFLMRGKHYWGHIGGEAAQRAAIEDFSEAIRIRPTFSQAFFERGHFRMDLNQVSAALEDAEECVRLRPDWAEAYRLRGLGWHRFGDQSKARADFDRAIALDPRLSGAYVSRGVLREEEGDLSGARADMELALRVNPHETAAYYHRGAYRMADQDHEGAIQDFTLALKGGCDKITAYANRGVCYAQLERWEAMESDFSEALRLKPDFPLVYVNRGVSKDRRKDYVGALADYNEALRLRPDYREAMIYRAMLFEKTGDLPAAIRDYRNALTGAPRDWNLRKQAEQLLKGAETRRPQ